MPLDDKLAQMYVNRVPCGTSAAGVRQGYGNAPPHDRSLSAVLACDHGAFQVRWNPQGSRDGVSSLLLQEPIELQL